MHGNKTPPRFGQRRALGALVVLIGFQPDKPLAYQLLERGVERLPAEVELPADLCLRFHALMDQNQRPVFRIRQPAGFRKHGIDIVEFHRRVAERLQRIRPAPVSFHTVPSFRNYPISDVLQSDKRYLTPHSGQCQGLSKNFSFVCKKGHGKAVAYCADRQMPFLPSPRAGPHRRCRDNRVFLKTKTPDKADVPVCALSGVPFPVNGLPSVQALQFTKWCPIR